MKLSIEHLDPSNGDFAFKKTATLELAEKLDPKLAPLLWEELSSGNFIWEARQGFPAEGSVSVSLSRPFKKIHSLPPEVRFIAEADPHYNLNSYMTDGHIPHALCAPFK